MSVAGGVNGERAAALPSATGETLCTIGIWSGRKMTERTCTLFTNTTR